MGARTGEGHNRVPKEALRITCKRLVFDISFHVVIIDIGTSKERPMVELVGVYDRDARQYP